jgi:hypothetical protein
MCVPLRTFGCVFYVQDERYSAMAWMPRSVYVQDERQIFAPCKICISHIHVGRIARWYGRDRDVTYQNNAGSDCRMPRSAYGYR